MGDTKDAAKRPDRHEDCRGEDDAVYLAHILAMSEEKITYAPAPADIDDD